MRLPTWVSRAELLDRFREAVGDLSFLTDDQVPLRHSDVEPGEEARAEHEEAGEHPRYRPAQIVLEREAFGLSDVGSTPDACHCGTFNSRSVSWARAAPRGAGAWW